MTSFFFPTIFWGQGAPFILSEKKNAPKVLYYTSIVTRACSVGFFAGPKGGDELALPIVACTYCR